MRTSALFIGVAFVFFISVLAAAMGHLAGDPRVDAVSTPVFIVTLALSLAHAYKKLEER